MAKKQEQPEGTDQATAIDYQEHRPQGITPRLSDIPHPRFGKNLGIRMIDPESLKVPKKDGEGEEFLDDPYLALPNGKGGWHITQVRADHASEMLTCDPMNGGAPTCRLATDAEVAKHLKVHGPGGHGNLVGRPANYSPQK